MMMWREIVLLVIFLLFLVQQICARNEQEHAIDCPHYSCGKIANISRPFRLKGDPIYCGDRRYELSCENNVTVLTLYWRKYHVQAINYNNFTIRVVDPGVEEPSCSSLPRHFLSQSNFSDAYHGGIMDPYRATQSQFSEVGPYEKSLFKHIIYLNCSHPVSENYKYVNTTPCVKWESKGYIYAIAGDLTAADFEVGCRIKLVSPTSWWGLEANKSSYTLMHRALVYGFEMSWLHVACAAQCGGNSTYDECYFDSSILQLQCLHYCDDIFGGLLTECGTGIWFQVLAYPAYFLSNVWTGLLETIKGNLKSEEVVRNFEPVSFIIGHYVLPLFLPVRFLFGVTLLTVLLIYKWEKAFVNI